MRARAWLVIVVALPLVGTAACSSRSSATIEVDKPVALRMRRCTCASVGWALAGDSLGGVALS